MESSLLLSELLSPERICVPLGSHTKAGLLRELVRLALRDADGEGSAATFDGVLAAVERRETEVSTAMGGGLAVPHGRTDLVSEVRIAAGLVQGVEDYVAPDGLPVQVAFLVLTPSTGSGVHVKVLARIARILHQPDSRAALLSAHDAAEFFSVIQRADDARKVFAS